MIAADTLERERETDQSADDLAYDKEFITDRQLILRLGVPERIARATIKALDKTPTSGFPPKVPIWGDRRHWPSLKAYFRRTCGSRLAPRTNPRGPHA